MRSHKGGDSPRTGGPPVTPLATTDRSDSNGSSSSNTSTSMAPASPVLCASADVVMPAYAAYFGQKDEQGRAHGYGAVMTPDGEIVQQRCGRWTAGELTTQGIIFITHLPPDAPLTARASLMYGLHPNGDYFVPHDACQAASDKPPTWGTRYHKDGSLDRGGHFIPPKLHGKGYRYDPGVGSLSGQFEHGVANGPGKYFYLNGSKFEGNFVRDKMSGLGRLTLASGESYEGEWSNGQRHGLGITRDAKGALLHVGRYAKDVQGAQCPVPRSLLPFGGFTDAISDQCDLLYPMGDFYIGTYSENNLPHGGGTLFHSSGTPLMGGQWVEGELHGHGFVFPSSGGRYVGDWSYGKWEGLGMHVGARGERYDGNWLNNRMHGLGRRVYEDGEMYEGAWAAGARCGLGMVWDKSGALIECGRFGSDGQGGTKLELSCPVPRSMLLYGSHLSAQARKAALLYANGSYYTGRLNAANEAHGAGCLYAESGEIIAEGIWDCGKLVDSTNNRARADSACGTTCLAMTLANQGRGTIMRGRHALLLGVPDAPVTPPSAASSSALSAPPSLSVSLPPPNSVHWGLSLLSFQCSVHSAPSSTQMSSALQSFLAQIQAGDLVFVLFNGYASAGPNGSTWLIPSDWRSGDTLERKAVSLDDMLGALQASQGINVILLDVLPAPASFLSEAQKQLKPVRNVQLPDEGQFFIAVTTATNPPATVVPVSSATAAVAASSATALTPISIPGSDLNTLLLPHLRTPGVHLTDAVMRANKSMLQLTGGQRRIISTSSLTDDIVLDAEKAMSTVRYY